MLKLKVMIENKQDIVKIPSGIRLLVRRCCSAVLNQEHMEGYYEVSVNFVDSRQIRALNKQFRNIDNATDVLSFPLSDNGVYDINHDTGAMQLGDIVISMERAVEQAKTYGHSLQREVAFLAAHSMLHLLGYDHEDSGIDAVRMREKEESVLTELGLPRGGSYVLTDHE